MVICINLLLYTYYIRNNFLLVYKNQLFWTLFLTLLDEGNIDYNLED